MGSSRLAVVFALVGAAGMAACNMLSGADGLQIGAKADPVDEDVDSGFSNGPDGNHAGDAAPQAPADAATPDADLDAGVDAASFPTFTDDFQRGDGTVGSGWMLKSPNKFTLKTGAVKQTGTGTFADMIVRRPSAEDTLNVEASVTVIVAGTTGDPSVHVRVQPGSDAKGVLRAYTFYPGGLDVAYLEREDTTQTTPLGSVALSPKMTTGQPFRVILRVTGTSPVHLEGTVETAAGVRLGKVTFDDADAKRIDTAGSAAFGSGNANDARFDDFKRVTLP